MEPVKFAVLGLNQGAKIVRDALKHEEVELVAVAGFGQQAESFASELGLKRYEDYRLLLRQEQLDAVAIALPNGLHVEAVEEALTANIKHILLEKPIANTVEEAQHIIDILRKRELPCSSDTIVAIRLAIFSYVILLLRDVWGRLLVYRAASLSQSPMRILT